MGSISGLQQKHISGGHALTRKVRTLVACLALAPLLLAHTASPQTRTPAKLQVGYLPIAECAHLYVAITKKYFEEEGLDVELRPMKGGANILPALQTGNLDVGFSNVVSLALLNSRLPVKDPEYLLSLFGGTYERPGFNNHALLTRPGSGIKVTDFARPGLRVALNTQRNVEELMLRRFLRKRGIKTTQLVTLQLGFPEMLQALDKGAVDVVSEVEPFIQPAIRSGRATLLAKQYEEVSRQTLVATYVVSRAWLEGHPSEARRFRRAMDKANTFIRNNKAETRQIIGSFTRIAAADLAVMGLPAFESRADEKSLADIITAMKEEGFITNLPSAKAMIAP
jgi:NitT/TauT family transport system substrate-binding protein